MAGLFCVGLVIIYYTDEFQSAVDVVCGACPYRVDACGDQGFEVDEKYCGRCMVRLMCDLFIAERDAQSELADEYPEWQDNSYLRYGK